MITLVGTERQGHLAPSVNVVGSLPPTSMTRKQIQKFQKSIEIDVLSGCWIWIRGISKDGYAKIYHNGKDTYGHRVSYEHWNGKIPDKLQIDHLCRNRKCVNPKHLEVVSTQENSLRGLSPWVLNSRKTHCPQGHPYIKNKRRCKECKSKYKSKYKKIKKEYIPKTHCPQGHEYTIENTYIRSNNKQSKKCRLCDKLKRRQTRLLKKSGVQIE